MELRLSCTNPMIYTCWTPRWRVPFLLSMTDLTINKTKQTSNKISPYFLQRPVLLLWPHFTNNSWSQITNMLQLHFAMTWNIMVNLSQNFAHVTTALLSWHMQNPCSNGCDSIKRFRLQSHKLLATMVRDFCHPACQTSIQSTPGSLHTATEGFCGGRTSHQNGQLLYYSEHFCPFNNEGWIQHYFLKIVYF